MAEHTLGDSSYVTLKDGRKLHYRSQGTGAPTVVFESGMGFSSALWGLVQPEIAKQTHVVAYDRAGIGKSDWDDADRTIDRIADDLEQLLQHLEGPLILVGYSWGGPMVRRVAARRTSDIRGLILLDQTDERNPEYFTDVKPQPSRISRTVVLWFMHVIGIRYATAKLLKDMPTDCRREIMWRDLALKGARNAEEEVKHIVPGLQKLKEDEDLLEGIEVTVVSGMDPELMTREYRPAMVEAHKKTAEALDRGRLVEAKSSAHFTPITEPELVIREVTAMVEKIREADTQ